MLEFIEVSHSFGDKKILSNISFAVNKGSIIGVIGANGAGKTTMIRLATGLMKLSSGIIKVAGYSLEESPREYQSKIGAVLEGKRNIYLRMNVIENLRYFAYLRGLSSNYITKRIEQLVVSLQMEVFAYKEVYSLSSGMQQKAAIACSLIHDPELIFLDEPTVALDYESVNLIYQYLRELKKQGKTLLITSHDFGFLNELVDAALFLENGTIRFLNMGETESSIKDIYLMMSKGEKT